MNVRRAVLAPAILVLTLLAVIAAGCAGSESAPATEDAAPEQATTAPAAESESSEGPQKLVVWDWQYASESWGPALEAVDEAFVAAHPGVEIEHVAQPQNDYYQLVQSANSAQSGPDVLMMHAGTFGVLNYLSSLEPLNSYIDPELREQLSGWESVGEGFDPDGEIYAIPGSRSGWVFYYNKELFEQAGLDPEQPPATFDELVAAAEQLEAAGITPFGGGNADQFGALMWLNDLFPGVFTIEESTALAQGEVDYTSPEFELVSQKFLDLYDAGFFPDGWASTTLWTEGAQEFSSGQVAMFAGIASDTISYREFNAGLGEDKVGVFYTPGIAEAERYYIPISSGPVWAMTKYAQNKDLAWDYIRFLTGVDGARIQWEVGGVLPINKAFTVGADAPPQVAQMLSDFDSQPTFLYVSSLMQQAVVFEWMKQMQSVIAGDITLDEALEKVQEKQDSPVG